MFASSWAPSHVIPCTREMMHLTDHDFGLLRNTVMSAFGFTGNREEILWREYIHGVGEKTDPVGLPILY